VLRAYGRVVTLLIAWMAVVVSMPTNAHAETIKVAFNSDWPPFSEGEGKRVNGLLVALTKYIIEQGTGDTMEAVGLPWARVQRDVQSGEIDAMVTFASDERRAYAWASEEVVFSLDSVAHVVQGSEAHDAIAANPTLETHRQFMHCAMIADNWTHQFLEGNDIPFDTSKDSLGCVRQIAEGRQEVYLHFADTTRFAVDQLRLGSKIIALPKVYASAPFRLLLSKNSTIDREFVSRFDEALAAMKADGRYDDVLAALRKLPSEIVISTLEWPPYTTADLPNGGATTEVVRRAFANAGIEIDVLFLPWKRAVAYAVDNRENVTGYFPGYHCSHSEDLLKSASIGMGPLALAERVDSPIVWGEVDDLVDLKVGTVIGYANTEAFDAMVADNRIRAIPSVNDAENLLKLAEGLLDAAVVDPFVMQHLLQTDPQLIPHAGEIRANEHLLDNKDLFLCLRDDARNRVMLSLFNQGLQSISFDDVWSETLNGANSAQ